MKQFAPASALLAALALLLSACGGAAGNGPSPDALVARGEKLYEEKTCAGCHAVDGSTLVGPTWKGLYRSEVKLADGTSTTADEAYLRESMLDPSAKTVEGFPSGLMETVIKPGMLSEEEVDGLIAYIKSLR